MSTIPVLNLYGSYYDMGREYGKLEKNNLLIFHQAIFQLLVVEKKNNEVMLLELANKIYTKYPQHYQDFLQGMSATSGLTLQQHIFINAFEYILYFNRFKKQSGCSAVVVWDKFTVTKEVIFGRNYDYFTGYPQFKRMLRVVVFHPQGCEIAVAMITFLGTLNATTNMNSQGLFLSLNNGYPSGKLLIGGGVNDFSRSVTPINLLSLMFESASLARLNDNIHNYQSSGDYVINVADAQQAVV